MMGEVRSMRTPPLPSPAEAPSPVAASQSPHPPSSHEPRGPPHSTSASSVSVSASSSLPPKDNDDGSAMLDDTLRIANTYAASVPHQQTPDVPCIPSINHNNENKYPDSGKRTQEDHGRSLQTLRELRRQMEELLAYQQMQQQSQNQNATAAAATPPSREVFASPAAPPSAPRVDPLPCSSFSPHESSKKRRISNDESPQHLIDPASSSSGAMPSAAAYSDSTSSAGTIRPIDSNNNPNPTLPGQTPSYPFPRMYPSPSSAAAARSTQESSPMLNHGHFKLTLPAEKMKSGKGPSSQPSDERSPAVMKTPTPHSVFLPPQHKPVMEDPIYPSPNLYDITLQLNADAGLDAWWSNVVNILQTYYGAERASLAVPGDATDLENVPWGQKAVFDQNLSDNPDSIHHLYDETPRTGLSGLDSQDTRTAGHSRSNNNNNKNDKINNNAGDNSRSGSTVKRPSLLSRHSFAGFGKDRMFDSDSSQLLHKVKADLNKSAQTASAANAMDVDSGLSRSIPTDIPDKANVITSQTQALDDALNTAPLHGYRQAVFPIPRPLEVESDPLIKRTGVVKLFGRTKPVVLTREYSQGSANACSQQHGGAVAQSPADDKVQVTPTAEPLRPGAPQTPSRTGGSNLQAPALVPGLPPSMEVSDEYEQVPPSPWSQSPAPSPAPRAQAEQNPFFASYTVDESAFAKNPPPHDYSNLEPLQAIGVDLAKSVVHIPLLHAGSSKQPSLSTLRFPVAVISILSPIIPYPSNLRQSLAYLMPHLTTSFCLAQQYSQLERQFVSRLETPRYGHLLGLGGTFSDESSELELVAGLSGHVNYRVAEDGTISAHASLSSPDEKSNSTKLSPPIPGGPGGTPGFELGTLGAATAKKDQHDFSGTSFKLTNDVADSYFNVPQQQPKSFREAIMYQQRSRLSKTKQHAAASDQTSPGKSWVKTSTDEDPASQDPNAVVSSPLQEPRSQAAVSPTQPSSSRHPSANSLYAQLQREIPRPFSDTVAQLMLNSVPLHLFLAKPQSGEVIWTNSKFDAYRRSQPQEQKLRDPWQNIHSSEREHVSQEWANALRTGSQFTERVRVKRFNDESAYRWFIFRANPLLSSTGEVLYWIGSFLDIHEQHIAELKAAQEREKFATDAKYRAFSNSIPQVVFEAAEYRGLIFANEQWHLYTGQKLEEALNFGFAKHIHPDDLEKCGMLSHHLVEACGKNLVSDTKDSTSADLTKGKSTPPERHFGHGFTPALDELVKRGVASVQQDENGRVFYSTEIRLRSKGGDFRWHLVRLVRVETSSFGSGEASWYGTCTDINDRKNLERELNKAMQQLNNQMESKTKFFSNMSHEIRTPLNGILGTIPFILDTQLDTDQRRMLDTIQNSSTNLRELVDNILDVSRVEAGKMSLVNSWFHVRSVVEDVIDTVASRAIDKSLEINYLMDVDVPPTVIGDRFRIRQVLINLVGNAVKFTSQGEIHICCSIHHDPSALAKDTELLLNFDVVDTGKGFSARDAERLMQRFSQLGQNGSQQHAGSGLGLFLSKQLVEMHGGKLTPSSKEGQGAKFSFYVKVDAPPPPTPEEQSQGARQPSHKSENASKPKKDPAGAKSPEVPGAPATQQPPASTDSSAHPAPLPTPDTGAADSAAKTDVAKETGPSAPAAESGPPPSKAAEPKPLPSQKASPCSILILCPLENTRKAIQQHIEQVVPHEVPFSIKAYPDIDDWRDMVNEGTGSSTTHLVLNLPNVDDVLDVIQYVSECEPTAAPTLVLISDLYQKRQVNPKIKELSASGRKVYTVPKPVKPSAFSAIFDPDNRRDLSKDRNQDMAREINNNFKTMSKMVKEVIGNKGYRVLLVEDDETNRMVCSAPLLLSFLSRLTFDRSC